jgi:hypothetical protein
MISKPKKAAELVGDKIEGKSILVYGPPKTGKTYALDDPNLNVHILDFDGGSAVLEGAPNVTIWELTQDLASVEKKEDHPFWIYGQLKEGFRRGYIDIAGERIDLRDVDIVAIDSFSRFQDIVKDWVSHFYAANRKREIEKRFGAMSDWGDLQDIEIFETKDWHTMTKRGDKSLNVMWIAHNDYEQENNVNVSTKIALQGKYAPMQIMSVMDLVCFSFKVALPSKADPNKTELRYGIYTQTTGINQAEVRYNRRSNRLPSAIPDPKWSKILKHLGYVSKAAQAAKAQRPANPHDGDPKVLYPDPETVGK